MAYAFRKYLNKRGSALFMVLSLMTALMILVMAMYFSVVASKDVQYKVFYQEQAYRSATSLSDAIVAGLKGNSWQTATGSSPLLTAFTQMSEGDTITTNGNDFKAFVLTGSKEEEDQLGAYTVSITRMADETISGETTRVYDVAITTSSGGVIDTTHTFIHIQEPETEAQQGKTNIFTSTGYVPNDVFLDTVETWTDLFYDNELVIITGQSHIYSNLYAGGSLTLDMASATPGHQSKPATWAIRNNFTSRTNVGLGTSSEHGLLMVGGDATFGGAVFENADIYVLGDAHFSSGTNFNNCNMYVYGNLVFDSNSTIPSNVYASGVVNNTGYDIGTKSLKGAWRDNTSLPAGVMNSHDMATKLDKLTTSQDYYKWTINDDAPAQTDTFIKELFEGGADYNNVTVEFDAHHTTRYLDWEGKTLPDYYGQGKPLQYTAVAIDDVVITDASGWPGNTCVALVIDTGDDVTNQFIIKVNPNRDLDGDNVNETFEWAPEQSYSAMTVIVRGKGSVIIDVPEGVTYQASTNTQVMHETWYAVFGGAISDLYNDGNRETLSYTQNSGSAMSLTTNNTMHFIHVACDEDCACKNNYTVKTTGTDKCPNYSECGEHMTVISCTEHAMDYSFCPTCDPGLVPEKDASGKYYGLCSCRIERSQIDAAVGALSPTWQSVLKASGDGTDWYYPNTNIFLVSCDESADIRLATDKYGATFSNASLWGFVYAPYMTYKGMGNSAGWVVFGGGMIVADYVIKNFDLYLACYPDLLPEDLMSASNRADKMDPLASKSWKISLAGY